MKYWLSLISQNKQKIHLYWLRNLHRLTGDLTDQSFVFKKIYFKAVLFYFKFQNMLKKTENVLDR